MRLRATDWPLLVGVLSFKMAEAQLGVLSKLISVPQFYASYEVIFNAVRKFPAYRDAQRQGKLQRMYTGMPFPCDVNASRSHERPISVHALRPGDIDVIGSMGDSLTAGTGALGTRIYHILVTNRGVSFSGGGQSDWRQFLTLPNIVKNFNPRLIGYSLSDALTWDKKAQFNVAEPGAMSADTLHQARILLKRMRTDKRVNFKHDWKLVTLMIGSNDFCVNICYENPEKFLSVHRQDLIETLDYLYNNAPRMLVNLIPAPNLKILMDMTDKSPSCQIYTTTECPCLIGLSYVNKRTRFIEIMDKWQTIDIEVATSERYRGREDFAIVVQPFSTKVTFPQCEMPNLRRNSTDYSYLSVDCFHFSQKTNAMVANALWNNMLEPVGQKATDWKSPLLAEFHCPTAQQPFIFTHRNSPPVA